MEGIILRKGLDKEGKKERKKEAKLVEKSD